MIIIKLIQEVLNKTQQDIANDLGVSRQTISMWYSGYKISTKNICVISSKYNIPQSILEKSQISGIRLNNEELAIVKRSLLSTIRNKYDDDISKTLLGLIGDSFVKANNYNNFIANIDTKAAIKIDMSQVNNDDKYKYLFIININKVDIFESILYLRKFNIDSNNYTYVIKNSLSDRIEVVRFGGGYDET